MSIRRVFGLVVLAAVLLLFPASLRLTPDAAAGQYPFDLEEVVSRSAAKIVPVRGCIDVAVTSAFEYEPQIAVCASNQYLVVFQHTTGDSRSNSQVYGQRTAVGTDSLSPDGDRFGIGQALPPTSILTWPGTHWMRITSSRGDMMTQPMDTIASCTAPSTRQSREWVPTGCRAGHGI